MSATAKRDSEQQGFQGLEDSGLDLRVFWPRRKIKCMDPKISEEERKVMGSWTALATCSQNKQQQDVIRLKTPVNKMLNVSQSKVCQNNLSPTSPSLFVGEYETQYR